MHLISISLKLSSIEKQIVWKSIVYTFYFFESSSRDQNECKNISIGKTQFLEKHVLLHLHTIA